MTWRDKVDKIDRMMEDSIKPISSINPEDRTHGTILFTKSSEKARMPSRKYPGDVGYDLYLSRDLIIGAFEVTDAHTDINIALPLGYWAMIVGRSSTLKDHGILVATGILDRGYTGALHIQCQNLRDFLFRAKAGDRIAQVIIQPIFNFEWVLSDELPETERGQSGFGSSGR